MVIYRPLMLLITLPFLLTTPLLSALHLQHLKLLFLPLHHPSSQSTTLAGHLTKLPFPSIQYLVISNIFPEYPLSSFRDATAIWESIHSQHCSHIQFSVSHTHKPSNTTSLHWLRFVIYIAPITHFLSTVPK